MASTNGHSSKRTLVLGATGKTGGRIVRRLKALDWPLRAGSRSGDPKFDWQDTNTWQPALRDVDSIYVTFQPDLAISGAVERVSSFVTTALQSGVGKLVLLSGRGEEGAQQSEQAVMNSGVDWTILRASWFCQNFSESYLLDPVLAGHVILPAGNIGEPFVDADDIADVAVAALTEKGHAGQIYELTGPRLLSFADAVKEIAHVTGRPIRYEQISTDTYASLLREYGVSTEYVDLLSYLFTEVLDGRNAALTDGVQRALGRKPMDFNEYVRKTAKTGIWNNEAVFAG